MLTIGKFDGVHLGHQAVIANVISKAKERNLPATVMVFEPQPEEVFDPDNAPARLSRLRDKYLGLKALGVDRLLCVKFNRQFANISAEVFVQYLLVDQLGVDYLVVGDDFRFGQKRQGDFTLLQQQSQLFGFTLASTQSFRLDTERISSSLLRDYLAVDDFAAAEQILGRSFSISGKVVHGEKNGRKLGFPTANILLKRCKSPVQGVYVVSINYKGKTLSGVANIGTRPTLNGLKAQLEVHIFDFSGDLYGQFLQVEIKHKIRQEKKFADLAALQQQIKHDVNLAKQHLATE